MMEMKLVRGAIAMVYQDPVTKQNPEGRAELVKCIRPDEGDGLEVWEVLFAGEGSKATYLRTISNRPGLPALR